MSNESRQPGYATQEEYDNARARFGWDDGDITWLDADGNEMTKEQVKQVQAAAFQAEYDAFGAKVQAAIAANAKAKVP